MRYLPLAVLQLRHAYYADQLCTDFVLQANQETAQCLRNQRIVQRPLPSGVSLFIQVSEDNTPTIPLDTELRLEFRMLLRNPTFEAFTQLPEKPPRLYTHDGLAVRQPTPLTLQESDRSNKELPVFGCARLIIPGGRRPFTDGPLQFTLSFDVLESYWVYYIITGQTEDVFSIKDSETDVKFNKSGRSHLNDKLPAGDEVAAQLARQYPDSRRWRLVSSNPVAYKQATPPKLTLKIAQQNRDHVLGVPQQITMLATSSGKTAQRVRYALVHIP